MISKEHKPRQTVALMREESGRCSKQGSVLAAEVGLGGVWL